jgi:phytoene dehydrogenase-like protein
MEPIVYGCVTSNITHGIAPAGKQLVTLFYPTAPEDVRNPKTLAKRKRELDRALHGLFPGVEKDILWKRVVALRMVDGVQVNVDQTEDSRPGVRVPGTEGLFLVGDSVGAPGAGGDVGNESVLIAYKAMTGKDV